MSRRTRQSESQQDALDALLPQIATTLTRVLSDCQRTFAYDSLHLRKKQLAELADLLVGFAEDVHAGVGLWRAYERYNTEFFGTQLPLTERSCPGQMKGIHIDRIRHVLWMLYPQLIPGLLLSTSHQDMERVAEAAQQFLSAAFRSLPRESGLKVLIQSSNRWGWEVKRKLIWLGTESYMFRLLYAAYLREHNCGKKDIACTDDFICQECTRWSGLGVIDLLAGMLDISENDRRDLRNWYERHASFYRVVSVTDDTMDAINVICDRPYRVRLNMPGHSFRAGQMVFGSLVPWRGEWYWSGQQERWKDASDLDVNELRDTMKRQNSHIVCRFWPEYEGKVREMAAGIHGRMMAFYGRDLLVYRDGLSMAADWQKELRADWESRPSDAIEETIKKHELKDRRPNMNIPKDLLENKDGIGVYINPEEGKEIMGDFNSVVEGLKRRGNDLTNDQMYAIRGFFQSDAVSPRFVHRIVAEYGDESIKKTYMIRNDAPAYWLEYLIRVHKGHYYRKRYPSVSVI